MPAHAESPVDSEKRLSLMQRTWRSIRKRRKGHHGPSGDIKHGSAAYKDKKLRKAATKVPFNGFNGHFKSGVPGRDGEEPETNIFKYIGIMLDIPDNPTTRQVVFKLLKVLVVMTVSYFALMALYFAAEYNTSSRLKNIDILVVDLDHSIIGSYFLNFTQEQNKAPEHVNWSIQSGYVDVQSVVNDVENGNYWGAIIVQANASKTLNTALSTPLHDYDPTKAFLFVYDGGRDPLTVKPRVVANMYSHFIQFTSRFNLAWVFLVLTYAGDNVASLQPLADAPQVLGLPVAFEELDVHPPATPIIASATTVAYIWIFLVAGGSTYLVAHTVQPLTRKASVRKTMTLLLVPLLVFLFSLSMVYSVVLRVFGVPFTSAGQFATLFLGMFLLQAAVASLVLFLVFLIPVMLIPAITITFVVMNVIAVFHPVELMPPFYRWAYAMPFLNAVQLARYVLNGSYNRLEYNLPILFAWIVVPIVLLPMAISRQKRLLMEVVASAKGGQLRCRYCSSGHGGDGEGDGDESGGSGCCREKEKMYRDRKRQDVGACGHRTQGVDSKRRDRSSEIEDLSLYAMDGEGDATEGCYCCYRRRGRHHRARDQNDGMDHHHLNSTDEDPSVEEDDLEDEAMIKHNAEVMMAAQQIRSLHRPGMLESEAAPSAPPEPQVLEASRYRQDSRRRRPSEEYQRSLIEMPQLTRHPYASELVNLQTPDEVK
ncbi:hypothetical protein BGX34_008776 [Mortierella sp. NVP85]|nr:hypothetical protein BGX34_008776 [Mortierella sp. NVP85]